MVDANNQKVASIVAITTDVVPLLEQNNTDYSTCYADITPVKAFVPLLFSRRIKSSCTYEPQYTFMVLP